MNVCGARQRGVRMAIRRSKRFGVRLMHPLSIGKLSERILDVPDDAIDSMIGGVADLRHSHK
jgi:hypothetical protein